MKLHLFTALLLFFVCMNVSAFDTEKASDERFKVSFVEPEVIPQLSALPSFYGGRERAIQGEQEQVENGRDPKEIEKDRILYFRLALFPIRVTDTKTKIVYEVQSDRRTIIATKSDGTVIWKINPFTDAKLEKYRSDHPYIIKIWRPATNRSNRKGEYLTISWAGGQQGDLDLKSGKYSFTGSD